MRRTAIRFTSAMCSTANGCAQRLGAPKRLGYGPMPIEALDLFTTSKLNAPINVFIHGGAWRQREAKRLRFPCRDVRQRRRAFHRARFRRRGEHQGRPAADGGSGASRGRLGLQERQELRRRSGAHLRLQPVIRRASRRQRRHHRLVEVRRAGECREGRAALLRHVRSQAGAAVEALRVRRLHRSESRRSCPRSAISTGSTAR